MAFGFLLLGLLGGFLGTAFLASQGADEPKRLPPPKRRLRVLGPDDVRVYTPGDSDTNSLIVRETDDDIRCAFFVTPGREAFSPEPIPEGVTVRLVITGTYEFADREFGDWRMFDACYARDKAGNFRYRYHGIEIDGKPYRDAPLEADRALHRYVLSYCATGEKMSILITPPHFDPDTHDADFFDGQLSVAICADTSPVKALTLSRSALADQAELQRKEQQLQKRVWEWRNECAPFTQYSDPDWLSRYARKHRSKLLRRREEIRGKHRSWLWTYPEEIAYLQEHEPDLYGRLTWEVQALAFAERLSVEKPTEDQPQDTSTLATDPAGDLPRRAHELATALRAFAHYEDDSWIATYAANRDYLRQLLADREAILADDRTFHEDAAFVAYLKATDPSTYLRATWRMRALAAAEKLSAERRKLTPDEYRARVLARLQVRAEDAQAKALQRLRQRQAFREELADMDLDEDEAEQIEQELLGEFFDDHEDGQNGRYRQL